MLPVGVVVVHWETLSDVRVALIAACPPFRWEPKSSCLLVSYPRTFDLCALQLALRHPKFI